MHLTYILLIFLLYITIYKLYIECPKLPENIQNGNAVVTSKREITYNCDPGYFLSTETHHFICKNDGNWNSDDFNPKCIKSNMSSSYNQIHQLFYFYKLLTKLCKT